VLLCTVTATSALFQSFITIREVSVLTRHKLPVTSRTGGIVTVLTGLFGLLAALTLLVTHAAGQDRASTVALHQSSVSTPSFPHFVGHRRHHRGSPPPMQPSPSWHQHVSTSPSPSSSTSASSGSSSSPAPSTSPVGAGTPSSSPVRTGTPSPTSAQVMPQGVPTSQVGKLLLNDTGDDLASWPRTDYGAGGTIAHSNGVLYLTTSGANRNGYSVVSADTYTSGIFESRIYFPGASHGEIADWPAFWLSSVNWPDGGEMDLAEGLAGTLSATYHYGINGTPEESESFPVTSTPGWHVITGVWTTGRWDVYYDGKLVQTFSASYVKNDPVNIILSAFTGQHGHLPGEPSTVRISYLRIWSVAGNRARPSGRSAPAVVS
jgi:hypothetical protein